MKFTIKVRDAMTTNIRNTQSFEDWKIGHEHIMQATNGNPFYQRGMLTEMGGELTQYVRILEDEA